MYLQLQGRKTKETLGDGNCLFRSFSYQLVGTEDEHITVRTLSVRFQNLNQSVFKPYLSTINQPTMTKHINHVETPGIFGTHMEILAMATYYGVPVFYCCLQGHSQQQCRWHCRPISSKDNHLRYPELAGSPLEHVEPPTHFELSYMHNTHYNSIVSLTGELRSDLPELNHEEVHVAEVL